MKWNLRLAAANRGIWKATELQRLPAVEGLDISLAKMYHLWSGKPEIIRLSDLDVICTVLGCGVEELLIPSRAKQINASGDQTAAALPSTEMPTPPMADAPDRDLPDGLRLLRNLQVVFDDAKALHSATVVERLHRLHGTPWEDNSGIRLTVRRLAYHLKPYGVRTVQVNLGGINRRGYQRDHLHRAWSRYLPRPPHQEGESEDHSGSA